MSRTHLEVKLATLAAEARIIKRKELKAKKWKRRAQDEARKERAANAFWSLRNHRLDVVRPEARAAHLALAFIRGVPYRNVEAFAYDPPNFKKIWHNVVKFAPENKIKLDDFYAWLDELNLSGHNSRHEFSYDYSWNRGWQGNPSNGAKKDL